MQENVIPIDLTDIKNKSTLDNSNMENQSSVANKYKKILSKISKGSLTIGNIEWKKDINNHLSGWVYFSVNIKDIGLSVLDFNSHTNKNIVKELFSNHMIDFIGEVLIRSNIDKFLDFVFSIDEKEYLDIVSREKHVRFGAQINIYEEKLTLCFHTSILQSILTEDFKHSLLS